MLSGEDLVIQLIAMLIKETQKTVCYKSVAKVQTRQDTKYTRYQIIVN